MREIAAMFSLVQKVKISVTAVISDHKYLGGRNYNILVNYL